MYKTSVESNQQTVRLSVVVCRRGRNIRVLIVVTMYNEASSELHMTLRKIAKNVEYITRSNLDLGIAGGADTWKSIGVAGAASSQSHPKPPPTTNQQLTSPPSSSSSSSCCGE